jgi:ribokinase
MDCDEARNMSVAHPILLSLGSINADLQVRVDQSPDTGQTLIASDFVRLSGGKAANVAVLARRLGVPARLLGRVGDDAFREQAVGPLRQAGVDLAYVSTAPGCATALSMIAVLPDGKKSIILANSANDAWDEKDLRRVVGAIGEAPAGSVLVADYEVPPKVVQGAGRAAAMRGLHIVIDPSPASRVDRETLTYATAVTPNPAEAEGLTGIKVDGVEAAAAAAGQLIARGICSVCVKFADGGCLVARHGESFVVVPVSVPVVDTTGAGDAFAGALAVALMERRPLIEAACFATAASHLAVTAYGSQPAYPSRRQIEALQPSLVANVRRLT